MKIASSSETLRNLYHTKFFPSPDMVAEVHWATKAETFHMEFRRAKRRQTAAKISVIIP